MSNRRSETLPRRSQCCCSADMRRTGLWVSPRAARLVAVTVNIATGPEYSEQDVDQSVIADIGLDDPERLAETGARFETEERNRVHADRGWIVALVIVLFAIHVSRMGFDKSALGILSPLIAVAGDILVALALTFFVIIPVRLFLRRTTRWIERAAWQRVLDAPAQEGLRPGLRVRSAGGSSRGCDSPCACAQRAIR